MRIPRRKRTWVLVLLGVAIVGAAAIWWTASAKSDFEKRFDRIERGMDVDELQAILGPRWKLSELGVLRFRLILNDENDETLNLEIDNNGRIGRKEFKPAPIISRLRRWWQRTFNSAPPF
jgi:hypothetical protein